MQYTEIAKRDDFAVIKEGVIEDISFYATYKFRKFNVSVSGPLSANPSVSVRAKHSVLPIEMFDNAMEISHLMVVDEPTAEVVKSVIDDSNEFRKLVPGLKKHAQDVITEYLTRK